MKVENNEGILFLCKIWPKIAQFVLYYFLRVVLEEKKFLCVDFYYS